MMFQVFNACWVPIVYAFFPETAGLQLEDIDHLFEKGGITGGVFRAKGGRTVTPGYHASHPSLEGSQKEQEEGLDVRVEELKTV